jgi:hypothetical protein
MRTPLKDTSHFPEAKIKKKKKIASDYCHINNGDFEHCGIHGLFGLDFCLNVFY